MSHCLPHSNEHGCYLLPSYSSIFFLGCLHIFSVIIHHFLKPQTTNKKQAHKIPLTNLLTLQNETSTMLPSQNLILHCKHMTSYECIFLDLFKVCFYVFVCEPSLAFKLNCYNAYDCNSPRVHRVLKYI